MTAAASVPNGVRECLCGLHDAESTDCRYNRVRRVGRVRRNVRPVDSHRRLCGAHARA